MKLIPVDPGNEAHLKVLYELLAERTPEQSISHKKMPTWEEHVAFVKEKCDPYNFGCYEAWYLLDEVPSAADGQCFVGSAYLTHDNEVGIAVFERFSRQGFGPHAVQFVMQEHGPRRYLANVNPLNEPSRKMFEKLGFKTIQHTLALEAE